jgi:hypothetical protein
MKCHLPSILAAFLLGIIAGYAGLLVALHKVQEPLTQSVHYVWYDWFMYIAWPGFILASFFFDPMSTILSKNLCMLMIALANGLLASLAIVLLLLASYLAKIACRKILP